MVSIAEYIVWGFFLLLLATVIWLSRDKILALFKRSSDTKIKQAEIPNFVGKTSSLNLHSRNSEDLLALLQSGSFRTLLSILLIKSLMKLQEHYQLELKESMTENECLLAIEKVVAEPLFFFMDDLIKTWTRLAWAHTLPKHAQVQSLYDSWVSLFDDKNEKYLNKLLNKSQIQPQNDLQNSGQDSAQTNAQTNAQNKNNEASNEVD